MTKFFHEAWQEAQDRAAETGQPGWDNEGGVPITPATWLKGIILRETLKEETDTKAHLSPCGDGSLHVYIGATHVSSKEENDARIHVEIHPSGCRWFVTTKER